MPSQRPVSLLRSCLTARECLDILHPRLSAFKYMLPYSYWRLLIMRDNYVRWIPPVFYVCPSPLAYSIQPIKVSLVYRLCFLVQLK